jgi:hypothetical protein
VRVEPYLNTITLNQVQVGYSYVSEDAYLREPNEFETPETWVNVLKDNMLYDENMLVAAK